MTTNNDKAIRKETKELINRMVDSIDDIKDLKRIFDYVHRIFLRRTGK